MEISIIIPTYKPEYYIWECLDSIKEQSLNKNLFEVLIILNGEKEPYYSEIFNYIKKYKLENFKLLHTEQNGVSNARNIGLDNCKGNYIAFIDDDDYIDKKYLEVLFQTVQKNRKTGIVLSSYLNFNEINKEIIDITKFELNIYSKKLLRFRQSFSVVWGKLIPKNIISDIRFNLRYKNIEDSLFMLEISKNIEYVSTTEEEIFYRRRVRKSSVNYQRKRYSYILKNHFLIILEYLKLFFKKEYSKVFIFIRILAVLKSFLMQVINNIK